MCQIPTLCPPPPSGFTLIGVLYVAFNFCRRAVHMGLTWVNNVQLASSL